jgi:pimeloyl-ACP methyl ester carboxylesterase
MYYRVYGNENRKAVVLIHPIGGNTEIWNDEIKIIQGRNFKVIVYDLRGHGKSEMGKVQAYTMKDLVGDLHALLNHLSVRKCTLVGHSIGGQISCIYAATHPGRVESILVISSSSEPIPDHDLEKHHMTRRLARQKGMAALARQTMSEHEVARKAFKDKKKRQVFTRMFSRTSVEGFCSATVALYSISVSVTEALNKAGFPISGIVGTDDEVFVRLMRDMKKKIPRMKLQVVKGDHWVIVESHKAFDRAFERALDEITS